MDEKLRILKMVEDKTITAKEAASLMDALGIEETEQAYVSSPSYDKKMFRIIVDSVNGDKVNIQFPVNAVRRLLKVTGKLPIPETELEGFDLNEMLSAVSECLDAEINGDFVNVTGADGTVVRIYVE